MDELAFVTVMGTLVIGALALPLIPPVLSVLLYARHRRFTPRALLILAKFETVAIGIAVWMWQALHVVRE